MRIRFEITEAPLRPETWIGEVTDPSAGAVAAFVGVTRNSFQGKRVRHLEYEAYRPMAERAMERIGTEIANRWPSVTGVAIAHRLGRVEVGEASVVVAISAPHRADALAACGFGIDLLKRELPVWKREVLEGGAVWRENEMTPDRGGEPP
ncbi:MAG TPA: molybdenum cofactor biosynthesis protein MoaE [Gemmatimonadota bacterium]|nr:molybdenum cofactor biosynthesis protein MoaE [Gemmatimonadota bacterium]